MEPKVHYHVHKSLPLVPILGQMHPVHTFSSCIPRICSNIFFSSKPKSSKWSLPFRFSDQYFVWNSHLFHAWYIPCLPHPPWLDHPNNIWWSIHIIKLLIMQSSSASYHFLPLRSKYSPQHPVPRHLQSMFFHERQSFMLIKNNEKNQSFKIF